MTDPRIAFVSYDFWVGGGTIFVLKLASALHAKGLSCHAFGLHQENSLASDFRRRGIAITPGISRSSIFEERLESALNHIRAYRPTALVVDASMDTCELLRYIPSTVRKVCVFHLALTDNMRIAAKYRAHIDAAVAVSDEVRSMIDETFSFQPLPIATIHLGIEGPPEAQSRSFPAARPLRVLYLGRLEDPAKRVRLLPEIRRQLCEANVPSTWTIAGDGPERSFLETSMLDNPKCCPVRFLGIVPYSEVPHVLREHDLILIPSDSESFSLSLHEAMAWGLVPVASALPGPVGQAVTSATGIPVAVSDTAGYARGIQWLHEHRREMEQMSRAGASMVSTKFSVEGMRERWLTLLERPAATTMWPEKWNLLPPLGIEMPWRFSAPVRFARSVLAKLRRRGSGKF